MAEFQQIQDIELMYEAPDGHDMNFIWVPLSDLIDSGLPFDPEAGRELEYQGKFRITTKHGKFLRFSHPLPHDPTKEFEDLEDEDLEECALCKKEFPVELIQQTVSSDGNFLSCPVCALKNRNEVHGLPPDTPFSGEQASLLYDTAVLWLKFRDQQNTENEIPK